MNGIEKITLKQAIKWLDALKVKYAIIDLEGGHHGNLEIKRQPIKPLRSPHKYEYGSLAKYLRPYLTTLEIGGTAVIPSGPFELPHVARSASSMAHHLWGAGNAKHTLVRKENSVELIRLG
jgi:hypothetical protein